MEGTAIMKRAMYVDAAGGMCLRSRFSQGSDDGLYRLDVFPSADGSHEFRSLLERPFDAGIAHKLPFSSVYTRDRPSVVTTAGVLHPGPVADCVGGEGLGHYLSGLLSRDTVHLYFESEGLCFLKFSK